MYTVSTLTPDAMKALAALTSIQVTHQRLFPSAVGYAVATVLSIPAEPLDDVQAYFRFQHSAEVNRIVSDLNEILPHSTLISIAEVQAFYELRCRQMQPNRFPLVINECTTLQAFFGLDQSLSLETLETIQSQGVLMARVVHHLNPILDCFFRKPTAA